MAPPGCTFERLQLQELNFAHSGLQLSSFQTPILQGFTFQGFTKFRRDSRVRRPLLVDGNVSMLPMLLASKAEPWRSQTPLRAAALQNLAGAGTQVSDQCTPSRLSTQTEGSPPADGGLGWSNALSDRRIVANTGDALAAILSQIRSAGSESLDDVLYRHDLFAGFGRLANACFLCFVLLLLLALAKSPFCLIWVLALRGKTDFKNTIEQRLSEALGTTETHHDRVLDPSFDFFKLAPLPWQKAIKQIAEKERMFPEALFLATEAQLSFLEILD